MKKLYYIFFFKISLVLFQRQLIFFLKDLDCMVQLIFFLKDLNCMVQPKVKPTQLKLLKMSFFWYN